MKPSGVRLVLASITVLSFAGCGWAGVAISGALLGKNSSHSTAVSDRPLVINLGTEPRTRNQAGGADDLKKVGLFFSLVEATSEEAKVKVEYSLDSFVTAHPASIDSSTITGLKTSPSGVPGTLFWDAASDGVIGFNQVSLRVTASDSTGAGAPATRDRIDIGNDLPVIFAIGVPPGEVTGNVVFSVSIRDSSRDPVSLVESNASFSHSLIAEVTDEITGQVTELPFTVAGGAPQSQGLTTQPQGDVHFLVWESLNSIPTQNASVRFKLRPSDPFGGADGNLGAQFISAPFTVVNNQPPRAILIEPLANPDAQGPIRLSVNLQDAESDPADLVIQWSLDEFSFPDLTGLADAGQRRRVLADPDERALRRIITPRSRVLVQALAKAEGLGSTGMTLEFMNPARALTAAVFSGTLVELLSATGATLQRRSITAVDAQSRRFTLDSPPSSPIAEGQRIRIRESLSGLLTGLPSRSDLPGRRHEVTWDAPLDLPALAQDSRLFLRVTAFSGSRSGLPSGGSPGVGKDIATDGFGFTRFDSFSTGDGLLDSDLADLDGDGFLDLITASGTGNRIDVFAGSAVSVFDNRPPAQSRNIQISLGPNGAVAEAVAAGDVTGDGNIDIVAIQDGNGGKDRVLVFRGDGQGGFTAELPTTPVEFESIQSIVLLNVNNDARLDLGVLNVAAGAGLADVKVRILLRNPSDPFYSDAGAVTLGQAQATNSFAIETIQANPSVDSIPDLIAVVDQLFLGGRPGTLHVLTSTSAGALTAATPVATGMAPSDLAVGDLDGDGLDDVITVEAGARRLGLFRSLGNGSFSMLPNPLSDLTGQPVSANIADLNGDGLVDVVGVFFPPFKVLAFAGLGNGSFVPQGRNLDPSNNLSQELQIFPVDVDRDGRRELLLAGGSDSVSEIVVLRGLGPVPLADPDNSLVRGTPFHLASADVDGDGRVDVVSADLSDKRLSIFKNQGNGFIAAASSDILDSLVNSAGFDLTRVVPSDLDGDGLLDLVAGSTGQAFFSFLQKSDGSFKERQTDTGAEIPITLEIADFDGDGSPDVVALLRGGLSHIGVYLGLGNGRFASPQLLDLGPDPQDVALGDIDGDGALDLVAVGMGDSLVRIFRGQGNGRFSIGPTFSLAGVRDIALADLDQDGHLDIIAEQTGLMQISVLSGDGAGGFGQARTVATLGSTLTVEVGDVDGNGRLDLLATADNGGNRELQIFFGRGDGRFAPASLELNAGFAGRSVMLADLNEDGDNDLVLAVAQLGGPGVLDSPQRFVYLSRNQSPRRPLFGFERNPAPSIGTGLGGDLSLTGSGNVASPQIYTIDTDSGVIRDSTTTTAGQPSPGFIGGSFHFRRLTIPDDVRLVAIGSRPLSLVIARAASIDGALILGGANGGAASAGAGFASSNRGGQGGAAGPGGSPGGAGGGSFPGSGGLRGLPGDGGGRGLGGQPGALPGAGAGHGTAGQGVATVTSAGLVYGNPSLVPIFGGSGGGGGAALDEGSLSLGLGDAGGGGGGGGGGVLRLTAGEDLSISGRIECQGGDGGTPVGGGGSGGGGAGGSILLQSRGQINVQAGARITALGGLGASGTLAGTGAGGSGRIRLEDADGLIPSAAGSVDPQPSLAPLPLP